jgi:hypothetical protein
MGFGAALRGAMVEPAGAAVAELEVSLEHADSPRTATAARPATEIA